MSEHRPDPLEENLERLRRAVMKRHSPSKRQGHQRPLAPTRPAFMQRLMFWRNQ
jgi:hypothetical protein